MSEDEIAWVAGIVEGEGHISILPSTNLRNRYPTLRVQMTDRDVVEKLYSVSKLGHLSGPIDRGPGRKDVWLWAVAARDETKTILEAIQPWMGERKGQAVEAALIRLSEPFRRQPHGQVKCGTASGYSTHQRKKEVACDPCKEARRIYNREWERARREARKQDGGSVA